MNEDVTPEVATREPQNAVVSEYQVQMALDAMRSEQNLVNGIVAGILSSIVGAGLWATITILTDYQIGWIAIGIGYVVGFSIRLAGKGIDPVFGIAGGFLSIVGCALGNLGIISYYVAAQEGMPLLDLLSQLNPQIAFAMLASTFEVMDAVFYAIAAYFGYKYAFRQVTPEDLNRALGKSL